VAPTSLPWDYRIDTGAAVQAALRLMLATLDHAGLDDDQHQSRCHLCRPELIQP